MPITHSWKIVQLDVAPLKNGAVDVVETIHYRLVISDGTDEVESYGTITLPDVIDPTKFVPFQSLTKARVEGWIESSIGSELETMKSLGEIRINEAKNPSIVSKSVPW